ncbi:tetratricopeptide repeat protein [Roseovarius sp. MBR-6]|uniref:tetratricopeptide repeat protein n=1 Tax=Roseovarius sp. MBR-6 TaxID=3156459 RepID=UPI0033999B3D
MELSAAAGLAYLLGVAMGFLKWPFSKPNPVALDPRTIDQIKPSQAKDGPALTVAEFIRLRRDLKADLEQELAEANEAGKTQLRARIAELESQITNPDAALAEARKRITDLEALLDREANQIGADRIAEAKAALAKADYSLADNIFAEIEARNDLAVQDAARAAGGRGEVAEAELRWLDAAQHYAKAARLVPEFDNIFKAREYAWRAGQLDTAHRHGADLLALARNEGTQEQIATALNEHALTLDAQGRYAEAEALYREALEIDRATVGEGHRDFASGLNNLAGVVRLQDRYEEAERLLRKALKIDRATLGDRHPEYAIHLNNLANVVRALGRFEQAETLYREALEIARATVGEAHPAYAIDLTNLGSLLGETGRVAEGRAMLEQARAIFRATLPPDHPHITEAKRRLDALPDD